MSVIEQNPDHLKDSMISNLKQPGFDDVNPHDIITVKDRDKQSTVSSATTVTILPAEIKATCDDDDLNELLTIAKNHLPLALGRLRDHIFVKAEGCYVWDEEGRKILDFTCGLGVTNLGQ